MLQWLGALLLSGRLVLADRRMCQCGKTSAAAHLANQFEPQVRLTYNSVALFSVLPCILQGGTGMVKLVSLYQSRLFKTGTLGQAGC